MIMRHDCCAVDMTVRVCLTPTPRRMPQNGGDRDQEQLTFRHSLERRATNQKGYTTGAGDMISDAPLSLFGKVGSEKKAAKHKAKTQRCVSCNVGVLANWSYRQKCICSNIYSLGVNKEKHGRYENSLGRPAVDPIQLLLLLFPAESGERSAVGKNRSAGGDG
jgi:hypothetical protein